MRIKFLIVLLILLSFHFVSYADTFTVTTNADSGPGSLRQAITDANANGTVVPDLIIFNIADQTAAGRTITLFNTLPSLSSNITIDGSTQPGLPFGVSDAKVKLQHSGQPLYDCAISINGVEDIAIYGIYFYDFRFGDPNLITARCAIYMPGINKRIKIGAPGKGNIFFQNAIAISNRYWWGSNPGDRLIDLDIKSNLFGLNEDGSTVQTVSTYQIIIRSFRNITLGGNTAAEGNYFVGNGDITVSIESDSTLNNGFVNVTNNHFGLQYGGTSPLSCGKLTIWGGSSFGPAVYSDAVINIKNNMFENQGGNCHSTVEIHDVAGFITIQGNKLGTMAPFFSCQQTGFGIWNCKDGIIGGDLPEERNVIAANNISAVTVNNDSLMTIKKNSMYCNAQGIVATSSKVAIPFVKINSTNDIDVVSGTATPNCRIEVFQNIRPCSQCNNAEIYMGETISDNAGNWSFISPFSGAVTATATTIPGVTGELAMAKFNSAPVQVTQPVCGLNNGSIIGMQFIAGTRYYWVKNGTDTLFNQLDLTNLGPGTYKFVVEQTKYCLKEFSVYLYDNSPVINETNATLQHPACGLSNGRIRNIFVSGYYTKRFWLNENRDTVGRDPELYGVPAGRYKLIVLNEIYGCGDSTDWYQLINQSGPNMDAAAATITPAPCNDPVGSITGITVSNITGTPYIVWVDSLNNIVGNGLDLTNVKGGKYKLKFKDQSPCDTLFSLVYFIPSPGMIKIDTTGKIIRPAGCTVANGSISNLTITNGEQYQWQNVGTSTPAGNSINCINQPTGNYQLTASNSFGCSAQSPVINIPQAAFQPIGIIKDSIHHATCEQNNGYAGILQFNGNTAFYTFQWRNTATNQLMGTGYFINNLAPGTYSLTARDTNGCEGIIFQKIITAIPKPSLDVASVMITDDECSLQKGSITGVRMNGLAGPTTYAWTDAANNVAGNGINLANKGAGQYRLTVTDAGSCVISSNLFSIGNQDHGLPVPRYDDLILPRHASASLVIKNFTTGIYSLYKDAAATQLISQNNNGMFTTGILTTDTIFYVQYSLGTCKSPVATIRITLVDKSQFVIATAFTPNNDGLNDLLRVKVLGYIELEEFRIYNRNGEQVFYTKQLNAGWDGRFKGALQQSSVFVWFAKGKDINGKPVSAKGSFVLIR